MFKGLPLASALVAQGHEVQVLTGFPNYPGGKVYSGYRIRLWQKEVMDGITVIRVPLFPSHDESGFRRALNYLSFALFAAILGPFLIQRPQAIYVYNLISIHAVARFFRLLFGSRILLDVQDLWPESVANSGMMRGKYRKRFLQAWADKEYRSADRVAVLSPGFKANLVQRGVPESRIDVIYNWTSESGNALQDPKMTQSPADLKIRTDNDQFIITFAGTMGKMQSLSHVIQAAKDLGEIDAKIQFVFIGGGVEVDSLRLLSADMKNVAFFSRIEPDQIGKVYAQSDVLLVHLKDDPIFKVTIPSKVQSYMYASKPILIGVLGDAAKLVEDAGAGVGFEPENIESLKKAIMALRKLPPDQLQKMGQNGKSYYDANLSFAMGSGRIGQALRECLPVSSRK